MTELSSIVEEVYLSEVTIKFDADTFWQLICGFLVFFMHAGFAMLEAGSIPDKHKVNILYKNLATVIVGGIFYFLLGYGFAYGSAKNNSFIGGFDNDSYGFASNQFGQGAAKGGGDSDRVFFFFQYAFCITAATITSGAVAGRIRIESFLLLASVLTAVTYPVVTHWVWSDNGWLSAFKGSESEDLKLYLFNKQYANACGVIDFAGSGVVHLTGGVSALLAAIMVGPRTNRFKDDGTIKPMPGHNLSIATLGTFILWFGWFGFNCGSTLAFDGINGAKVAVTTSVAPATACITSIIIQKYRTGHYDLPGALNAILAGLVSITAGCSTVSDFSAMPIGFVGALIYIWSSEFLLKMKIDDPIGAAPVHGFCGVWGVLSVGIFATPADYANAYACPVPLEPSPNADWLEAPPGYQMLQQLILVLSVIAWVSLTVGPFLLILSKFNLLRVSKEEEEIGLDKAEHGIEDYTNEVAYDEKEDLELTETVQESLIPSTELTEEEKENAIASA